MGVVDLTNKVVQKNCVLIGHAPNKNHEVFLRLENDGFRSTNPNVADIQTIWDTVTANYVAKVDKYTKVGVEVNFILIFRPQLH